MDTTRKQYLLDKTTYFLDQYERWIDVSKELVEDAFEDLWAVIKFHNYRYHSLNDPLITDGEYDKLIMLARGWENEFPELFTSGSLTSSFVWSKEVSWFEKKDHKVPMLSLQNTYNAWEIRDRAEFLQRQFAKHAKSGEDNESVTTDPDNGTISDNGKHGHNEINETADSQSFLEYYIEAKLDGSSVEFIYTHWRLSGWVTRWDGTEGEDITEHVQYLGNLPRYIKEWEDIPAVHLRGEVVMPQSAFEKVNSYQEEQWWAIFSNSRNAAAWTLRQLNPQLVEKRWLICYCFELLFASEEFAEHTTADWLLSYLTSVWIPVFPRNMTVSNIDDLVAICEDNAIKEKTQGWNIACDWLVIKLNDLAKRKLIWSTQHHPRWAIAYKYPAQEVAAHLIDISYQVWRTGVITPLAHVEPVSVSWVTISRATLHNFDFIRNRDIRKNDRVWLKRSGEVIPYVIWPIKERRTWSEKIFTIPTKCPICWWPIENDGEQVAYICSNPDCTWKRVARLKHFVSRRCMNISWLGDAVIEMLVESWLVMTISDIFKLSRQDKKHHLSVLPWIWSKKVAQILKEVEQAKNNPLRRLIHGIGLLWVWTKVAKTIGEYLQLAIITHTKEKDWSVTYDFLVDRLDKENLLALYGIGEHTAQAVEDFFTEHKQLITELIDHWLFSVELSPNKLQDKSHNKPHATSPSWKQWPESSWKQLSESWSENSSSASSSISSDEMHLEWETIVITWSFDYSRDQLSDALEHFWASVTWSVSSATTKLLAGENAWSKRTKAKHLNIAIVWLDQLYDLAPGLEEFLAQKHWEKNAPDRNSASKDLPKQSWLFDL